MFILDQSLVLAKYSTDSGGGGGGHSICGSNYRVLRNGHA